MRDTSESEPSENQATAYSTGNLKNKINDDEKMEMDSKNKYDLDAKTDESDNPREDLRLQ